MYNKQDMIHMRDNGVKEGFREGIYGSMFIVGLLGFIFLASFI